MKYTTPAHNPDIAIARKRCALKRYLFRHKVYAHPDTPTHILRGLVKGLHAVLREKQTRQDRLDILLAAAEGNHYVRQLLAVKSMWGLNSAVGTVTEGPKSTYCRTVSDLIAVGFVPRDLAYLDTHLPALVAAYDAHIQATARGLT